MAAFLADIQSNHLGLTPDRVNESNFLGQESTSSVQLTSGQFVPAPTVGWVLTATDLVGHYAWANPGASALQVYGQQYQNVRVNGPITSTVLGTYIQDAVLVVTAAAVGAKYQITYGMDLASATSVTQAVFGALIQDTTASSLYHSLGAAGQSVGSAVAQIQNMEFGGVIQYVATDTNPHTFQVAHTGFLGPNITAVNISISSVRVA